MNKIKIAAMAVAGILAVGLLAGCGGKQTPEDQVRSTVDAFFKSVKNDDGKCLRYFDEKAQGTDMFVGGCSGLHDLWMSEEATAGYDVDKAKIVVTGKTATVTPPAGEKDRDPDQWVLVDGKWKITIDDDKS
jgi:hypothetical protein